MIRIREITKKSPAVKRDIVSLVGPPIAQLCETPGVEKTISNAMGIIQRATRNHEKNMLSPRNKRTTKISSKEIDKLLIGSEIV